MSLIEVRNLRYSYAQSKKTVLNDISFKIEKGTYLAIAGKNGSGKSTLARLMCSLLMPESGTVKIEEDARIGLVFQSPKEQIVSGIVYRDTAFGPQNLKLNPSEIELRTIESLNLVEMLHKAKSSTSALSLGQTQKIAFSGMVALFPEILILDEAVSMLDPLSRNEIYAFLRYWHESGNTIIHITHDKDAILESEKTMVVSEGSVIFYDDTKSFFQRQDLQDNVFGLMEYPLEKNENVDENGLNCKKNPSEKKSITFRMENVSFSYSSNKKKSEFNENDDVSLSAQRKMNSSSERKVREEFQRQNCQMDLKNISFSLYSGTVTALTGPSGSGKSTIMELCNGLLEPAEGKIYSCSKPALALQNSSESLFEKFAVDDVAFGPLNCGMSGKKLLEAVKISMDKVNLPYEKFKERLTFELSGGEQKRLSVAGILAMNREVLFFDEPTAGLDGNSRHAVLKMLRQLADEGKTVVFSTHKMDELQIADREIRIEKGILVKDSFNLTDCATSSICKNELKEMSPCSYTKTLNALRNITSILSNEGEEKKSMMQKIPSFARILIFLLLFVLVLSSKNLLACMIMTILSIIYCKFCGFSIKKLIDAGIKILPFLGIFCVFQMIFHPALENEIHFTDWKWFTVSPSKLFLCLNSILKTEASMACISGFFVSIPEYDLIDGLKILLKPLELLKIPVRYFILILEVLFRFIPLMVEEAASIIKLQVVRGGFKEEKSKLKKIRAFLPLFVPLIIQTIKKSEALADAITMRCFK